MFNDKDITSLTVIVTSVKDDLVYATVIDNATLKSVTWDVDAFLKGTGIESESELPGKTVKVSLGKGDEVKFTVIDPDTGKRADKVVGMGCDNGPLLSKY